MRRYFFEQFLKHYWLRPENALLMLFRSEAVLPYFKTILQNPNVTAIDVSCGDGLFTFITCGGQLDDQFDVFLSSKPAKIRTGNYDMFDNYNEQVYNPIIIKQPDYYFSVGT